MPKSIVVGVAGRENLAAEVLAKYEYLPFRHYRAVPREKALEFLRQSFQKEEKEGGRVYLMAADGGLRGIAAVSPSAFESEQYGMAMGRLSFICAVGEYGAKRSAYGGLIEAALEGCRELSLIHLSCKIPTDDVALVHALEQAGFLMMDTMVQHAWDFQARPLPPVAALDGVSTRPFIESDLEPMRLLAADAFTDTRVIKSRYTSDPRLPLEKTARMYAEWFTRSARGDFADVVIIVERAGIPIGFSIAKTEHAQNVALGVVFVTHTIGAVVPSERKGGVNTLAMNAANQAVKDRARHATLLTEVGNFGIHRACYNNGARIATAFYSFHKWLGGE